MSGTAVRLAGVAVLAMAGVIEAVALGVLPVEPGSVHAPVWVVHVSAGMFGLMGLWILARGTRLQPVLDPVVGPVALIGLLSILHWVAFGPGVRRCSGGFSLPFVSTHRPVGDLECRLAFGYGAVLFDGVILGTLLSSWAERALEGWRLRVVRGAGTVLIVVPLAPFLALVAALSLGKAGWAALRGTERGGGV